MGLDIAFNRADAVAAGMVITRELNGCAESIARTSEAEDPDYWRWLQEEVDVILIPGTDLRTTASGGSDDLIVRANKWGRMYEPLTTWLKANGITWSEF